MTEQKREGMTEQEMMTQNTIVAARLMNMTEGLEKTVGLRWGDFDGEVVTLKAQITPAVLNAVGYVHGGAFFTMADAASGLFAMLRNIQVVTLDAQMSYLRSATEGELTCECREIKIGRSVSVYENKIFDQNRNLCAYGIFSMAKVSGVQKIADADIEPPTPDQRRQNLYTPGRFGTIHEQDTVRYLLEYGTGMEKMCGVRWGCMNEHQLSLFADVMTTNLNPMGFMHGGALYTLAETTASFFSHLREESYVVNEVGLHYLRSATSGTIRCDAEEIKRGKSISVYRTRIYDENERLLTHGTISLAKISKGLTEASLARIPALREKLRWEEL